MSETTTPDQPGMDSIGAFIGNLHGMLGHDQAAAILGQPPGDKRACLLCQYEQAPGSEQPALRQAVIAAIGTGREGEQS